MSNRHSLATLTEIWNKHQSSSSTSSSSPRTGQHHHHHHHQHHPQNYANRVSSTFTNLIGSSTSIHSDTPVQQGSLPTTFQLMQPPTVFKCIHTGCY